jgi:hypothetical protein
MALYPPNLTFYTDPIVQNLARGVAEAVTSANEAIKAYNDDVQHHSKLTFLESIFRELALPVLAWAFGLGIGRRTIDLYRDLSDISRRRLRKFSGYSIAQPLAQRVFAIFRSSSCASRKPFDCPASDALYRPSVDHKARSPSFEELPAMRSAPLRTSAQQHPALPKTSTCCSGDSHRASSVRHLAFGREP